MEHAAGAPCPPLVRAISWLNDLLAKSATQPPLQHREVALIKRLPRHVWNIGGAGLLVVVVGLALLLRQCSSLLGCDAQGLPRGPVTIDQVKSHPEAHLFYPGAHLYWPISGGQEQNAMEGGTNVAFAGGILTASDSPDAIYSWYKDWLLGHGWHEYRDIASTVWLSHLDFQRGDREFFTVAVDDPSKLATVLGTVVPEDRGTVFEVRYRIFPAAAS